MSKYLFLFFLITIFSPSFCQGKFDAGPGIGLFDGICLKARYGNHFKVGISQGFASIINPTAIEMYYWLTKKSKTENVRRYYIMAGYSATIFARGYENFEKTFFYPRIGRTFFLIKNNERYAINFDVGFTFLRSTNPPEGYITDFFPYSSSLSFFVRL